MSHTLLKTLIALVPSSTLFIASAIMFGKEKRLWSVLQLIGAAGILMVVATHLCESLQIFPWMHWGQEHSAGHYLDLFGAAAGITLFPLGYLLHALTGTSEIS